MTNTATADQPGAGMMKWMMYLMPLMFMFMFNNYASGLSYYYFISTLISIIQTYAIRATVDKINQYLPNCMPNVIVKNLLRKAVYGAT